MLLSIIIPVYNKEKYLRRCLNSIVSQIDGNDIEVIILDDGSTDSSLEIIKEYRHYPFVHIYSQNNQGVSNATNFLFCVARGEYIINIDSDDWVEQDMFKTILSEIKAYNHPDIVQFYSKAYDENGKFLYSFPAKRFALFFNTTFLINKHFHNYYFLTHTGKVIKKELLQDIKFDGIAAGADTIAVLLLSCKIKSFISIPFYFYNVTALTSSESRKHKAIDLDNLMIKRYIDFIQTYYRKGFETFYLSFYFVFTENRRYQYLMDANREKIKQLNSCLKKCLFSKHCLPLQIKLACFFPLLFPEIYKLILRFKFKTQNLGLGMNGYQ